MSLGTILLILLLIGCATASPRSLPPVAIKKATRRWPWMSEGGYAGMAIASAARA